jgi:hypothetical protein
MRFFKTFALVVCFVPAAVAAPPKAEVVSVTKIWDKAPHNAFTDLAYWNGQFVCAFREGRAHVATDGKIRILTSPDGENWSPAALLALDGFDLRDAGLSVMPDGRLMLNGGAAPRKTDKDLSPTGTFAAFSKDATNWTKPEITVEPGRWLWRVTWHDGKAYGISYSSGRPLTESAYTSLVASDDGLHYRELVPKLFSQGIPTEATLRFGKDATMYCLQRRDAAATLSGAKRLGLKRDDTAPRTSAFFGSSRSPYTEWDWKDLELHVGGPNFIQLPSGRWIAAGRFYEEKKPFTQLAVLDVEKKTVEPFLKLPSGGDTSYPGLVWHDNMLWVSYYSSHEGKTSIYLAKVRLN